MLANEEFLLCSASLLASAGMDNLARIWNVWNASDQQMVQQLSSHTAAVKDIQWSTDGKHLLSCGFDKVARLTDVEYGSEIKVFADENVMNVVRFHPLEDGSFLAGGGKGTIKLWDIRSGKPVKEYSKSLGQILDLDFNKDGKRFVSTSDIAKRNASDRAIIVWDYNKQIALSNQVRFSAPSKSDLCSVDHSSWAWLQSSWLFVGGNNIIHSLHLIGFSAFNQLSD